MSILGDFVRIGTAKEDRVYEELPELPNLARVLETYLEDYNLSPEHIGGDGQLQLVFFRDAVEHIVRLARILRQPRYAWWS
jgi:dynein heavy chain